MKTIFYVLFFLFSCPLLLTSQQDNYERLYNQGQLPVDYTQPSQEKFNQLIAASKIKETDNDSDREDFFLESTYLIDQLLESGYVLFNDPISEYVNDVLDVIVASNPELQKKSPRVYTFRSTEVNAFAVDQGMIFVSIGLLSQLENEAQLALVLSHELVHVQEEHGLDGFIEASRIDRDFREGNKINTDQFDITQIEKNRYSREQEIEADDRGLKYFLNTNYNFTSIKRVFDILRYSYLPFDEVVFEPSILEKLSVSIPENYLLDILNPINLAKEDEEQSSHPALSIRGHFLRQKLGGLNFEGKEQYIVSESRFKANQMKCRVDLIRLFLNNQALPEAIYSTFLMSKIHGNSSFTNEIIGKALYGLTKFKNNENADNSLSLSSEKIEGESQQVFHIIEKLTNEELNVVAIAYNYDRYRHHPENQTLRALLVDLFAELYFNHEITSLNTFKKLDLTEIDTIVVEKGEESLRKIDKIKRNKNLVNGEEWHKLAFSEVLADTMFQNIAQEGFDAGEQQQRRADYYSLSTADGRKNNRQYKKEIKQNGFSLGIDKVVIINPLFIQLNGGYKNLSIAHIDSEERQKALKEVIQYAADLNNVEITVLDTKNLKTNDTEQLNDIITAKQWMDDQLDSEGFIYQSYNQEEIQNFVQKYGTPYIMSVVVISLKQSNLITQFLKRKTASFVLVVLFDVRDGKQASLKSDFKHLYMNDMLLKSELYDAFFQISKTDKK